MITKWSTSICSVNSLPTDSTRQSSGSIIYGKVTRSHFATAVTIRQIFYSKRQSVSICEQRLWQSNQNIRNDTTISRTVRNHPSANKPSVQQNVQISWLSIIQLRPGRDSVQWADDFESFQHLFHFTGWRRRRRRSFSRFAIYHLSHFTRRAVRGYWCLLYLVVC